MRETDKKGGMGKYREENIMERAQRGTQRSMTFFQVGLVLDGKNLQVPLHKLLPHQQELSQLGGPWSSRGLGFYVSLSHHGPSNTPTSPQAEVPLFASASCSLHSPMSTLKSNSKSGSMFSNTVLYLPRHQILNMTKDEVHIKTRLLFKH